MRRHHVLFHEKSLAWRDWLCLCGCASWGLLENELSVEAGPSLWETPLYAGQNSLSPLCVQFVVPVQTPTSALITTKWWREWFTVHLIYNVYLLFSFVLSCAKQENPRFWEFGQRYFNDSETKHGQKPARDTRWAEGNR